MARDLKIDTPVSEIQQLLSHFLSLSDTRTFPRLNIPQR